MRSKEILTQNSTEFKARIATAQILIRIQNRRIRWKAAEMQTCQAEDIPKVRSDQQVLRLAKEQPFLPDSNPRLV